MEKKGKKDPKKCEKTEKRRICYNLKKHPSPTNDLYKPRQCSEPDKFIGKCPPPIDVCKGTNKDDDASAPKKKNKKVLSIEDEIVVQERAKPPRCPTEEDPCAGGTKPVCKLTENKPNTFPECGRQADD